MIEPQIPAVNENQTTSSTTIYFSVTNVVHWFCIKVYKHKRELVEILSWSGLRWELRLKYDWYFKYRAALLQIKYPKFEVVSSWGNNPASGKSLDTIIKNKITRKKATITSYRYKLKKAEETWSSLFPIEDDVLYQKAVKKINRLESELQFLISQNLISK